MVTCGGCTAGGGLSVGVGVECGDLHACPASLDSSLLHC